jgi:sugar lactone lactonase YvrE
LLIAHITIYNLSPPDQRFLYVNDTQARIIQRFEVNFDGTFICDAEGQEPPILAIFAQMTGEANDCDADCITVDAEKSIYYIGLKGVCCSLQVAS